MIVGNIVKVGGGQHKPQSLQCNCISQTEIEVLLRMLLDVLIFHRVKVMYTTHDHDNFLNITI